MYSFKNIISKFIISGVLLYSHFISKAQNLLTQHIDSIASLIDKDTSLKKRSISLDTLYSAYGAMVKTEVSFLAYSDIKTNQVFKIVWNTEESYYCFVTIYYYKGAAIKGIVKAKYRQSDTNPEFETSTVFYYKEDKVIEEQELNGSDYRANGFWYLNLINQFIKLAGLN